VLSIKFILGSSRLFKNSKPVFIYKSLLMRTCCMSKTSGAPHSGLKGGCNMPIAGVEGLSSGFVNMEPVASPAWSRLVGEGYLGGRQPPPCPVGSFWRVTIYLKGSRTHLLYISLSIYKR